MTVQTPNPFAPYASMDQAEVTHSKFQYPHPTQSPKGVRIRVILSKQGEVYLWVSAPQKIMKSVSRLQI